MSNLTLVHNMRCQKINFSGGELQIRKKGIATSYTGRVRTVFTQNGKNKAWNTRPHCVCGYENI